MIGDECMYLMLYVVPCACPDKVYKLFSGGILMKLNPEETSKMIITLLALFNMNIKIMRNKIKAYFIKQIRVVDRFLGKKKP
jgi:hypothetical protein